MIQQGSGVTVLSPYLTFLYSLNVVLAYFSNEKQFPKGLGGLASRRKSFIKKPTNSLPLLA
jgi:hypothetical protein